MHRTNHTDDGIPALSALSVARLAQRPADAHKGAFGHALVVGGDLGTGGAVLLSAEAALRCGAGLVSLATRPEQVAPALTRLPETMCLGVASANQLMEPLSRAGYILQRFKTNVNRYLPSRATLATLYASLLFFTMYTIKKLIENCNIGTKEL